MILSIEHFKEKRKVAFWKLLEIFKQNELIKNNHYKIFKLYQELKLTEKDINSANMISKNNIILTRESKLKINNLRNLIFQKKNANELFIREILVEFFIRKEKINEKDLQKIRTVHLFFLTRALK